MPAKVNDQLFTRPPWERMMKIHQAISSGSFPSAPSLGAELEVSARTIKRDIDFMKYRLDLPIEYESRKYGYYYAVPVEKFPSVPVTEAEIFSLLVAQKAIAQYHGTSFEKPLQSAFQKLVRQLDHESSYSMDHWEGALSFRPFAPDDSDLPVFQTVTRAIAQRRVLAFSYKKLGAKQKEKRRVQPYHMTCVENHWYLIGFDLARKGMRTFALNRLSEARLEKGVFRVPRGFKAEEYLRGSFGVFKGSADFDVVVQFDAWAADLIRGRRWHPSQEIIETSGGGMRLRFRLDNLEEIERWILSWGIHATVVRPGMLVERVRKILGELGRRYEESEGRGGGAQAGATDLPMAQVVPPLRLSGV